jgi:hypothetical protein
MEGSSSVVRMPQPVVARSNLYDCLCMSCCRGEESFGKERFNASGGCSTELCYGITCGGRYCLRCVRQKQVCFSCGSLLEITFMSMAKFNSFRRFPLQFRNEARALLFVCRQFGLSRDVRVLLVKALSEHYHRPRTVGPRLFEGEVRQFLRIEIFQLPQSGRVLVHVFNLQTAALTLSRELRCAQLWTLSGGRPEKLYRRNPNHFEEMSNKALGGGCGHAFCVYLPKHYHLEIDMVTCEFAVTEESFVTEFARQTGKAPPTEGTNNRVLRVAFSLKL